MKIYDQLMVLAVRKQLQKSKAIYLKDLEAKELDRAIRNGIYQSLFATMNYDAEKACKQYIHDLTKSCPDVWEVPELTAEFDEVIEQWGSTPIVFKSEFLNEQFAL